MGWCAGFGALSWEWRSCVLTINGLEWVGLFEINGGMGPGLVEDKGGGGGGGCMVGMGLEAPGVHRSR